MLVHLTSPRTDKLAREMMERFRADGYCPFGNDDFLIGFIKDAQEVGDEIVLTIEVTNPSAVEYLLSLKDNGPEGASSAITLMDE